MQGGLVATLVVEQNQSLVSALLLSSPGLDTDPAFGSFTYTVLVRKINGANMP